MSKKRKNTEVHEAEATLISQEAVTAVADQEAVTIKPNQEGDSSQKHDFTLPETTEKEVVLDSVETDDALEALTRDLEAASKLINDTETTPDNLAERSVADAEQDTNNVSVSSAIDDSTVVDVSAEQQSETIAESTAEISEESALADESGSVDERATTAEATVNEQASSAADVSTDMEESSTAEDLSASTEIFAGTEQETAVGSESSSETVANDIDREVQQSISVEQAPEEQFESRADDVPAARDVTKNSSATRFSSPEMARYAPSLVVHYDRSGKITEQYRALRTNLLAKCRDGRLCMMVTSSIAGEGKTVTCLNLGIVMAEKLDRRTIVVDYDLRSGKIAELLGMRTTPGVIDLLQGRATLEEVIQPTIYPNLFVLPSGQIDPALAGEYMCRTELKTNMDALREKFDYILVDSPAVNIYSDAGITGMITGDALFVLQMNKTSDEEAKRAIQTLRSINVNIAGMLLTKRQTGMFIKSR